MTSGGGDGEVFHRPHDDRRLAHQRGELNSHRQFDRRGARYVEGSVLREPAPVLAVEDEVEWRDDSDADLAGEIVEYRPPPD